MKKKEITICSNCRTPLIPTFAFPYKEYYCLNCGRKYEMFDDWKKVEATLKLIKLEKKVKRLWKPIIKNLLTGGAMRRNCDICSERNEPHLNHCNDEDKQLHKKALEKLDYYIDNKIEGV